MRFINYKTEKAGQYCRQIVKIFLMRWLMDHSIKPMLIENKLVKF